MSVRRKPYKLRKPTPCQALDMNGGRCRRTAVRAIKYHGDGEIYGYFNNKPEPQWVLVNLCDKHSEAQR